MAGKKIGTGLRLRRARFLNCWNRLSTHGERWQAWRECRSPEREVHGSESSLYIDIDTDVDIEIR